RRGDALLIEENVPKIDILKIDVEGYEKRVLLGIQKILHRDRPLILFELMGTGKGGFLNESEIREVLYPAHKLFSLDGKRRASLVPFDWNRDMAVCLPAEHLAGFGPAFRFES